MELLKFCVAISLIVIFIFWIYARWRWRWENKIWDWVLSERKRRGLETESLQKLTEGKASFASIIEGRKDSKDRKLIRIIISHLVLYLFIFGCFAWCALPFGWRVHYISPTTRNIVLLVMVVVVFPLVSIVYEYERRKIRRKKQHDVLANRDEKNH